MTDKLLLEISKKLNVLISLSMKQLSGDRDFSGKSRCKKGVGDLARYLADSGIDPKNIAEILGAPLQSIRTFLTPQRRK